LTITAALAATTAAVAAEPVMLTADCVQGAAGLAADGAEVRSRVPAQFELIEAGDKALIFLYTVECSTWQVNGGSAGPNTTTAIAAFVHGASGPEAFDIYGTHSDRGVVKTYKKQLGLNYGRADATFDLTSPLPGALALTSEVPYEKAPFAFSITGTETSPVGVEFPSVHWQLGSRGLVRHTYTHNPFHASGAFGEVTAPAGSPLADMMGAESASTGGTFFRFVVNGVSELATP
jgi:hypothetical protein